MMSPVDINKCQDVALEFVKLLTARDYSKAYEMTAGEYRRLNTVEQLGAAFEYIVPGDWGPVGPIEIGQTMTLWRGKEPADVVWIYVSIGGDVYSEAVILVAATEDGRPKIRTMEFGRP